MPVLAAQRVMDGCTAVDVVIAVTIADGDIVPVHSEASEAKLFGGIEFCCTIHIMCLRNLPSK